MEVLVWELASFEASRMGLYVQKATSTTTSIGSFDPCDGI